MGGHPAQSAAVVQGRRDLLRLTETLEGTPGLPDEVEIMQIEPEVNGLLEPFPVLGKAFKGRERLLETRPRFSVCRALDRLDARLPEVGCRFPPCLGPKRVMREPVDPFGHAVCTQLFEDHHTPGVQRAPPFLEEAAIGHLVGEGVLERVFELREEARLIEKLGGLEVGQAVPQLVFGRLRDGVGHILSDDRGHLEEALVLPRQPVDPGGQTASTVAGTWMSSSGFARR